jgi:hypothetical protein
MVKKGYSGRRNNPSHHTLQGLLRDARDNTKEESDYRQELIDMSYESEDNRWYLTKPD